MAYIAAVSKRLVAATGAFLAAVAFAGSATAYADEPNNNQPQPQPAELASAPVAQSALAEQSAPAEQEITPAQHEMVQDAQAEQQRQQADAQADQAGQVASTAGATQTSSMATSIGSSMAMMGPMMAIYAPMMLMPLATPLMSSLATGSAGGAAPDLAATGSAAATDAFNSPLGDLSNLDFTPALEPDAVTAAAADAGANLIPAVPIDAALPDVDPTMGLESLGDTVIPGLAEAGGDIAANVGGEATNAGVCLGLAFLGLC